MNHLAMNLQLLRYVLEFLHKRKEEKIQSLLFFPFLPKTGWIINNTKNTGSSFLSSFQIISFVPHKNILRTQDFSVSFQNHFLSPLNQTQEHSVSVWNKGDYLFIATIDCHMPTSVSSAFYNLPNIM